MIFVLAFIAVGFFVVPNFQGIKAQSAFPAWDFEDHAYVHSELATCTDDQIIYELKTVNALFKSHNLPSPQHIAYPNGSYSEHVASVVSQYRSTGRLGNRGATFPESYPLSNKYALSSRALIANTTFAQVKAWVDAAVTQKGLALLYTHKVSVTPTDIDCTPKLLGQVLDYLVAQQNTGSLSVMTMRQAYTEFNGQKAVIVISFDDGWVNDYTLAWPMFKARGLAGTSYIVGNTVNSNDPNRLTWAMVAEMAQVDPTPKNNWSITVTAYPTSGGTTSCTGNVDISSGGLTVTATPSTDYVFNYWLFDGNKYTSNPIALSAQSPGTVHELTAFFTYTPPTPTPTPTQTSAPTSMPPQNPTSPPSHSPSASPNPTPTLTPSPSASVLPSSTIAPSPATPTPSLNPIATSSASPSAIPTQVPSTTPAQSNLIFSFPTEIVIITVTAIVVALLAVGTASVKLRNRQSKTKK